jgi:alcohol dehydrogenase class IV
VPHGVAIAGVLAEVMRFNLPMSAEKIALAACSLGVAEGSASSEANARAVLGAVESIVAEALGDDVLSGVVPSRGMLDTIVGDALADPVIDNTPRMPTAEQVEGILARTVGSADTA